MPVDGVVTERGNIDVDAEQRLMAMRASWNGRLVEFLSNKLGYTALKIVTVAVVALAALGALTFPVTFSGAIALVGFSVALVKTISLISAAAFFALGIMAYNFVYSFEEQQKASADRVKRVLGPPQEGSLHDERPHEVITKEDVSRQGNSHVVVERVVEPVLEPISVEQLQAMFLEHFERDEFYAAIGGEPCFEKYYFGRTSLPKSTRECPQFINLGITADNRLFISVMMFSETLPEGDLSTLCFNPIDKSLEVVNTGESGVFNASKSLTENLAALKDFDQRIRARVVEAFSRGDKTISGILGERFDRYYVGWLPAIPRSPKDFGHSINFGVAGDNVPFIATKMMVKGTADMVVCSLFLTASKWSNKGPLFKPDRGIEHNLRLLEKYFVKKNVQGHSQQDLKKKLVRPQVENLSSGELVSEEETTESEGGIVDGNC